jgi:predicted ATPase
MIGMGQGDIHKLETCLLDDIFEIRLKKEGDSLFTPIDRGLSGGEQALALISVAMLPKDRPLIVDQPEDELGPALITGDLVEQIRRVKPRRQMIFVTHIPNIPVLADSEQIIYVEQKIISDDEKHTKVRNCGSLDNLGIIKRLLELDGGKAAFDKRQKRYLRVVI